MRINNPLYRIERFSVSMQRKFGERLEQIISKDSLNSVLFCSMNVSYFTGEYKICARRINIKNRTNQN